MKIVLFNAPPRAGKDTAANGVLIGMCNRQASESPKAYITGIHKMATPLKEAAHALFGVTMSAGEIEMHKDEPLHEFLGRTPRQVYISLSEDYMKPTYGISAFAHIFINRLRKRERLANIATGQDYLCICSDLGFNEELEPIVTEFGADNVLLVRIKREGCDFKNDSRSYLKHPDITSHWLHNNGTVDDLQQNAFRMVADWLDSKGEYANKSADTQNAVA